MRLRSGKVYTYNNNNNNNNNGGNRKCFVYREFGMCVLCKRRFNSYDIYRIHNPFPLSTKGRCCQECLHSKVLPARLDYFTSNNIVPY